ncbi:MAG: diaminopimelate epimerase [Proteobacteria bacterium]|nr:diaminopimelate epimerase [Pseudomonadota bacterium]
MKLKFTKMHGLGNDFIVIDCRAIKSIELEKVAANLCDRRHGVGADQLLILKQSNNADFKMEIYNADGSEVEMCGNGIRCFAKYLLDQGITEKADLEIETMAGIIRPKVHGKLVEVNMGEPILNGPDIPVKMEGRIQAAPISVEDKTFEMTCVSMGNPHCIIFVDDVDNFPLAHYGPLIEKHELFPNRINVEFIQVLNDKEIKMRVWERGSGETLACGTGACASAVASVLNEKTHRRITVHLAGGDLDILWGEDNIVYMTGPGVEVFEGTIDI